MTTKTKLLDKINLIENDSYLEALLNYLEESEKETISLSKSDIESIIISDEQLQNDQFLTQEKLKKKVGEWIGK